VLSDLKPVIEESRQGVTRIAKSVRSLGNFARAGSGDEITPNSLDQIVEDALQILQNEIKYVAKIEKESSRSICAACLIRSLRPRTLAAVPDLG
jgi:two-component system, NtrC family, sensor kinase